ncbi:MAG: excinuclease ABC subunit UvrA [Bdellovibrionales bacterium]|nr:excinuclease ABC subunit UvrA [Bdellovibrionales bacterium]
MTDPNMKSEKWIHIRGARQHNLKDISVSLPRGALSVITGPSGSGKSSLAFDTLFAEGQRRYMESLSTYARQFLDKYEKPEVDDIEGLTPTIALEQKNHTKNSRSTVGTATELYDYLRLIYAKLGKMYCPQTGEIVKKDIVRDVVTDLLKNYAELRAYVVFPVEFAAKSKVLDRKRLLSSLLERGFSRIVTDEALTAAQSKKDPLEVMDIEAELAKKTGGATGRAGTQRDLFVVSDRLSLDEESRGRLEDSLVNAYAEGFGRSRVLVIDSDGKLLFMGRYAEYPSTGGGANRYPELTPQLFSFNSPMGACEACKGFGNILTVDPDLVIPNPRFSISQGAIDPLSKPSAKDWLKELLLFCNKRKISIHMPWKDLTEKDRLRIWNGEDEFRGVVGMFSELEESRYKMQVRVFLSRYRSPKTCQACSGHRLRPEARNVLFHAKSIGELCAMSIENLSKWFKSLPLTPTEREMSKDVLPQVHSRLDFLIRVGLEYLTLDRLAKTLSGGEAQRIALANQLGSRLTQTCYVLDEPSIGLHPRDTERLIEILRELRDLKNSVVVVEHDPDIIRAADYLVDIGPEAGENGGQLLFQGEFKTFQQSAPPNSSTGAFVAGREQVPVPMRRRMDRFEDKGARVHWLEMTDLRENNLKGVDLKIPLGMLTCVTGVSGSGKSSAIRKTLYPALAKILLQATDEVGRFGKISGFDTLKSVVMIDQDPIGRSPRSNPITFMKGFDEVRSLLASTDAARKKHYHAGHFSFNVPGGRCETCEGDGYMRVEMVFMEDIFLRCDICEGKRFKKEILDIRYNGKNVDDILSMTVTEARRFFGNQTKLHHVLGILERVGLGYIRLGQSATTLSGGESQRLKIARELATVDTAGVLYVLDEPTTGLHFRDVRVLANVLHELTERGNSVVVIEHNLDFMKTADWIIDFGPDGGERGGDIVAEGTPEDIVSVKKSHTAKHLAPVLKATKKVPVPEFLAPPKVSLPSAVS